MGFPLLSLPHELLLKVVTNLSSVKTLNNVLSVPEIKERLAPDLCVVVNYTGPIEGFKNVDDVPRLHLAQLRTRLPLPRSTIYLIEYEEVPRVTPGFNRLKLEELKHFKNLFAFVKVTYAVRFANILDKDLDIDMVPPTEMFVMCKQLNVCASQIDVDGDLDLSLQGRYISTRKAYDIGVLDMDNIHFGRLRRLDGSIAGKITRNCRIEFEYVEEFVDVVPTQPLVDCFTPLLGGADVVSIGDHHTAMVMQGVKSTDILDDLAVYLHQKTKSQGYELKHVNFDDPKSVKLLCCYHLEDIRFPKKAYGDKTELVIGMMPRHFGQQGVQQERPVVKDLDLGHLESMVLYNYAWMSKVEGWHSPNLKKLDLHCYSKSGTDIFEGLDPEKDLKFLETVETLFVGGRLDVLHHAQNHLHKVTQLELFVSDENTPLQIDATLPSVKSLRVITHNGSIPQVNLPNLETVLIVPFSGLTQHCLQGLVAYPPLKHLFISIAGTTDPHLSSHWPSDLNLTKLERLNLTEASYATQEVFLPTIALPSLKVLEFTAPSTTKILGHQLTLDAPNLEVIRMSFKLYDKKPKQSTLEIKGYAQLRSITLRSVCKLHIEDCPQLFRVELKDCSLEKLTMASPIPPLLTDVVYESKDKKLAHDIPGWDARYGRLFIEEPGTLWRS